MARSLIEEWERKKREELQKRREESARKKSLAMEAGQKALGEFEAKRQADVERAYAKNRTDEKDTIASMEVASLSQCARLCDCTCRAMIRAAAARPAALKALPNQI